MKKIKILHILNHANIAGTEQHVVHIFQYIDRLQFDCTLLVFKEGPLIQKMIEMQIEVQVIPRSKRFDLVALFKLIQYLRYHRFDIIHSHCGIFALLPGRFMQNAKVFETRHGLKIYYDELHENRLFCSIYNFIKSSILHQLIAVSQADRDLLIDRFHIPESKVHYIPNGVPVHQKLYSKRQKIQFISELKINKQGPIIGTVARFEEQKGLIHLVKAIPKVKEKINQIQFLFVGDGPLREELIREATVLGVRDDLIFTGYRPDAQSIMAIFDIFILPSLWEGMSYAILEAMAMGLPVITTDVFGNRELIEDGVNGLLIRPKDSEEIAASIVNLLSNPKSMYDMANNNIHKIKASFNAQIMTKKLEEIYLNQIR